MKLNKEVIWTFVGMILVVLSYVLLDRGNPQNKWNKIVLIGLFFSLIVKMVMQFKNNNTQ
jgi:uncharacterized membrane protein